MADQLTFSLHKFSSLRAVRSSTSSPWTDNWKQAGYEEHALQGTSESGLSRYRSLLQFDLSSLTNVKQILKAELHIFSATDHVNFKSKKPPSGSNLKVAVKLANWSVSGGGESLWNGSLPDNGTAYNDTYRATGVVSETNLRETVLNVMPLVRYWAPKSVLDNAGAACKGKPNYGLVATTGSDSKYDSAFASNHHVNTSIRPFLVLTVVLKGGPGVVTTSAPNGNIPSGTAQFFTGKYEPGRSGDKMSTVTIKRSGGGLPDYAWTTKPSSNDVVASTFSVPVPASWPLLTTFTWSAAVHNTRGELTPWSAPLSVRWTGTPPVLTQPQPNGVTLDSLISVSFRVRATVAAKQYRAARWRVQLRTQTASSNPTWGDDVLWDTGPLTVPLSAAQRTPVTVAVTQDLRVLYGGPALVPATYSWRVQAEDVYGALSPWLYADLTVTAPYVTEPGSGVNLTGYAKVPPHRIRIFAMGANRGPGKLLAELTDAANAGASEFYNSPGEFFFTIPATHPQVSVIEPYQCHYALEQHTGEGWRGKAYGLITDFDATEDEVVFYGTDYLGLLARSVEERFDPTNAELATDKGGAKYSDKSISYIITDQLNKAKAMVNSPVAFITVGDIAALSEKVTIYASFKQRLPFISGLIDSARAGTGRRTRLVCERAADGTFRWRLLLDPGLDRPNLRLEYGGLVQGFRTVPFGNWGTAVAAIGRTVLGTKVYSALAVADGISESTYGHWPSPALWADIDDLNDLRRRAAQAANRGAKVGKQMGLGLRVGALSIKDGWDITDSVPVDIKRGVVDTTRFGSGYWTIWGWTWNSYPDGHDALTLSLAPREDKSAPNPDLIPSKPILSKDDDWVVGAGPPTAPTDHANFTGWPTTYVDSTTGHIYKYDALMDTGDLDDPAPYENITLSMEGNPMMPSTGGGEGNLEDPYYPTDYRPVSAVPVLPVLPDAKYPEGSTVSLDGVLYTNHSDVWEAAAGAPGPPGPPGPAGSADVIPPPAPVIHSVVPSTVLNVDGTSMTNFLTTVGYVTPPAGLDDLDRYLLESTRFPRDDDPALPDWSRATVWFSQSEDATGVANTPIVQPNVLAAELYWQRVYAIDKTGNRSVVSATVAATSSEDASAPPAPADIVVEAGMSTLGVRWAPVEVPDLSYVEVQWRESPAGNWVSARVGGTLIVITGLTNATTYDVRLRSVDWSGNTVLDPAATPLVTVKATDPDAGWVSAGTATPTALPGSALVWDEAMIADLFAGNINADWITAGTLKVGGAPDSAAAIEVYDAAGELVGRWTEEGIEVMDPASPYKMVIAESSLYIYDLTDPANPFTTVAITPLGIDASSITFGSARGGHNLVENSSFEMGAFGVTNVTSSTWDLAADWNAAGSRQGADVNLTTGASSLIMQNV